MKRWLQNLITPIVTVAVEEHIAKLQSSPNRHVSCPVCGKNYNLLTLGVAHNVRAITICCDNCQTHIEVRPSMFWNKIEVEKR